MNEVKAQIKNYPYPISGILNKYLRIPNDKYNDKHSLVCDIFESLIKFIAIVGINEALIIDKKINKKFPKGFDFLKHPSLGHWVSVIRDLSKDAWDDDKLWLDKIYKWYNDEKPSSEIIKNYDNLPEIEFPKGFSSVSGIINSLVTYRNKVWKGHGASIYSNEELEKRIPSLEYLLKYILSKASFLNEMNIFYVQEVKKLSSGNYEANGISFMGTDLNYASYKYIEFEPKEIYLSYDNSHELQKRPLSLSPLMEWQNTGKSGEFQFYFFNDVKRTKLEYLSYIDNSFYYHKEIKKEIENLFKVDLEKSSEDYDFIVYQHSEEERKQISSDFFLKGLEKKAKEDWEGAIIAFEDALEWFRNPEIIVEMCECMLLLGDDLNYIITTLESAFEIDANFLPAYNLKIRIENDFNKENIDPDENGEKKHNEEYYTFFDFIVPNRFKNMSSIFLVSLLIVIYGLSCGILFLFKPNDLLINLVPILLLIPSIIFILGINSGKYKILNSYFSLLGQTENMRKERFNKWFYKNIYQIFGYFRLDKTKNKIIIDYNKEKIYVVIGILFVTIFSLDQITLQKLYDEIFILALIRFLNQIIFWLFIAIVIRYVIGSTIFIKEYSKKSLSPVISSTGNDGFRKITKIFMQNLGLLNLYWIFQLMHTIIVSKDIFYTDFLGVGLGFIIIIFWIWLTPLYINRALKFSKSTAIADYDSHLKLAFNKFLKNPDENTMNRLEWLIDKEYRVKRISARLFTFYEWTAIVLTNIFIMCTIILYVLIRLKIIKVFLLN